MRILFLSAFLFLGPASGLFAQISFKKQTQLLNPARHYSGAAIAVADMNGDGHDDILRLGGGIRPAIEYQTAPNQPFEHTSLPEIPNEESQWGICAADLDNNGYPDVMTAGYYDGIKLLMADSLGLSYNLYTLDEPETFAQSMNFVDINNDGWLDAFVCHDDGPSRIFLNDGNGQLNYAPQMIDFSTMPPSDKSGNYGSVWSDVDNDNDLDLYIAKCRQLVTDSTDGRRINQLFWNNGDGTYSQDLNNTAGLRIGAQSWTADFGDIDNDGDFDCFVTNHDQSSQLLENDGAGHFSDISASAGLYNTIPGLPVQGIFRDFDNDGFVDILIAGFTHSLFRNNGNKSFSRIPILDDQPMESYAVGDLNSDGFLDIYAGYGEVFNDTSTTPDALWFNEGNGNHFFGLNLHGVQSNKSAVGAKIQVHSALGTQTREVRSGESYGIMNSFQMHFGMGQVNTIDSVTVRWPSGTRDVLYQPALDQYHTLWEGGCTIGKVGILAGKTRMCSGDSTIFSAPAGFVSYRWNNGSEADSIVVHNAGHYHVTVTSPAGCTAVSENAAIVVDPIEIPVITPASDTVFCLGDSVVLHSSPAAAYWWSNGDTTASIVVTHAGLFSVMTQGLCAKFHSAPISMQTLEPALPATTTDTVGVDMPALLSAVGEQVLWYEAAIGGVPVFVGPTLETPPLGASTTYWVSNRADLDVFPNIFTGMKDHMGSNFASTGTNGALVFDCYQPLRLSKVKVYTNRAGVRKIQLRTAQDSVLQSLSTNIPIGTSVLDLNFDIPAGINLKLTTDAEVNKQNLGYASPQLRRSDKDVIYPYEVPGRLRIKSSSLGNDRYYYFYDWEIDVYPYSCESVRVPVTAVVDSTILDAPVVETLRPKVFPNPGKGVFQLVWEYFPGGQVVVVVKNAQGQILQTQQIAQMAGPLAKSFDLSGAARGMYCVEITTPNGVVRRKVMIQ